LLTCLSELSKNSFIKYGGFKILKRWIKLAEDDDNAEELILIMQLCKSLPFDAKAAKLSEIGKAIKKLLKFRSLSKVLETLQKEVKSLINYWTDQAKIVPNVKPRENKSEDTVSEVVTVLNTEFIKKREKENNSNLLKIHSHLSTNSLTESKINENIDLFQSNVPIEDVDTEKNENNVTKSFMDNIQIKQYDPNSIHNSLLASKEATEKSALLLSTLSNLNNLKNLSNNKIMIDTQEIMQPMIARSKKSLDMAESARKLLELRSSVDADEAKKSITITSKDEKKIEVLF
jgi:hypothetical protein